MDSNQLHPNFPKNNLNLKRGTIIVAIENIPKHDIKSGDELAIGYNGTHITTQKTTWELSELTKLIQNKILKVTDHEVDLSCKQKRENFQKIVEQPSKNS